MGGAWVLPGSFRLSSGRTEGAPISTKLEPLRLEQALAIQSWKYEGDYAFYDSDDSPEVLSELLDGSYYGVEGSDGALIGFFCYGRNAQVPAGRELGLYAGERILDIGLGMRPELTGQGRGVDFLTLGMQFARTEWKPDKLRLTVAAFNLRAIRCYMKSGFHEIARFDSRGTPFIVMLTSE